MILKQNDRKKTGIFQFLCFVVKKITHCAGSEELQVSHFTDEDTEGQRVQCLAHIERLLEAEGGYPYLNPRSKTFLFIKSANPLQNKIKTISNKSYHLLSIY